MTLHFKFHAKINLLFINHSILYNKNIPATVWLLEECFIKVI